MEVPPRRRRPARVCSRHKGGYGVQTGSGYASAEITGKIRYSAELCGLPLVGDWVEVQPLEDPVPVSRGGVHDGPEPPPARCLITGRLPRYSLLRRKAPGRGEIEPAQRPRQP